MSEEQKEAIEILETLSCYGLSLKITDENIQAIDIVLDYIDKLQKEIEQLKDKLQAEKIGNVNLQTLLDEKNEELDKYKKQIDLELVEENYIEKSKVISKDKIRDKIKELEENSSTVSVFEIDILKELLGE